MSTATIEKNGAAKAKVDPADKELTAAPPKKSTSIVLPYLTIEKIKVRLLGDSPLVCHAWSEKAKKQMRDTQQKKAKQAKEARDPEADYRSSLYPHPDGGYGFPSIAFKSAAVDACSHIAGITKVEARGAFHVIGDMVRIIGEPRMREDMVRVGMGAADLRYRGEFTDWSCEFTVRYNVNVISPEQIFNLFNTAGFAIGVGEHRPQKDGSWGMFHVATAEDRKNHGA